MSYEPPLPLGEPAGFPRCPSCPYLHGGTSHTCTWCAGRTFQPIGARSCPVCSQYVDESGHCRNGLCQTTGRNIGTIRAIAYLAGDLQTKIHAYKYGTPPRIGWATIFGRLLLGYLETHMNPRAVDLVVANPTYLGPGEAGPGHTERVIDAAYYEDLFGEWPLDVTEPRAIIKTGPTPKSAGGTLLEKQHAARKLRALLRLPDPGRIQGKRILVYDDVCTSGSQLDAVAGHLIKHGGAEKVDAVVLARAPWR